MNHIQWLKSILSFVHSGIDRHSIPAVLEDGAVGSFFVIRKN